MVDYQNKSNIRKRLEVQLVSRPNIIFHYHRQIQGGFVTFGLRTNFYVITSDLRSRLHCLHIFCGLSTSWQLCVFDLVFKLVSPHHILLYVCHWRVRLRFLALTSCCIISSSSFSTLPQLESPPRYSSIGHAWACNSLTKSMIIYDDIDEGGDDRDCGDGPVGSLPEMAMIEFCFAWVLFCFWW